MIFEDISSLENLPIEEYTKLFGNKYKAPCTGTLRRSNMMLNPLNLKHLNSLDENIADVVTPQSGRCYRTVKKKRGTL